MRTNPSKGNSAWLLVLNIYSREAFARPVKNKEPANVRLGLKAIFDNELQESKPAISFSDAGWGILGASARILAGRGCHTPSAFS